VRHPLLSKRPVGDEVPRIDCLRLYLGPQPPGNGTRRAFERTRGFLRWRAMTLNHDLSPIPTPLIYDELRRFFMIFAYLWLVFLVFLVHEWIVLADHHIGFRFYGLAAINAVVLSKIMLIAEGLGFAERFENKPLIVPIVYKSVLFSLLLVAAYILEEIVIGQFHGRGITESLPALGGGGVGGTLSVTALLCIALVPFFAFREIARTVGEAEFRTLMLGPTKREMKWRGSISASDSLSNISASPANVAQ
jgi:hypothetical protein